MAFVDSLLTHGDADVVMVERRHRAGGHWLDAYPFVQLHQPSRYYGVDSTSLGFDRIETDGGDAGFFERASGSEICAYYDDVMRHRFLASGRVRFFPMSDHLGGGRFRSRVTGEVTEVAVRRSVVDATYMASSVPATDPAPFVLADGARCVPVGALTSLDAPAAGYVVVGGGKTALDAIGWLLDQGEDPDDIAWIRPRDSWVLNRAFYQPGAARTLEGTVLLLEAMRESATVDDLYLRLEEGGVALRTDRSVVPTMMRGATISLGELDELRRVERVVRLGHVQRVESDRVVLDGGEIAIAPGSLVVHCAAPGLGAGPPRPIFGDHAVTLQLVTRLSITLSGTLLGLVEASGRSTEEKNRLCPPTTMPQTPFDYVRVVIDGIRTELGWGHAPELQACLDRCRLNLMAGIESEPDQEAVSLLQGRLLGALPEALPRLETFAAVASPAEQARRFAR
jgi:hypothetical protein